MEKKVKYGLISGGGMGLFSLFLRAVTGNTWVPFWICLGLTLLVLLLIDQQEIDADTPEAEGRPAASNIPAGAPVQPKDLAAKEALAEGQTRLRQILEVTDSLQDGAVRKEVMDCAVLCDEILKAAQENEKAQGHLTNFFHHYLPMFQQMLESYAKCETAGVLPASTVQELTGFLDVMESAMKKLKENVYTRDVARLSVDMDVMEALYRADGLLDDGLFPQEEKEAAHEAR